MPLLKLLPSPWENEFAARVGAVQDELMISSPFISMGGVDIMIDALSTRDVDLLLVTDIFVGSFLDISVDPEALLRLYRTLDRVRVVSVDGLHAKVYIFDGKVGVVTSDKMSKSVTVRVDRTVRHKMYKRYVRRSAQFMAHDEQNRCKIGDTVEIIEARPLSKRKRWRVTRIVRPASGVSPAEAPQGE